MGCRQIGKTHLVKEFGKNEYEVCIYMNFADNASDRVLFEGDLNADSLLERIVLSRNVEIVPGRTLMILDEIQDCDNAYYSLKSLAMDSRIDVISTGSFLGVVLNTRKCNGEDEHRVSPMGYAEFLYMHPMDFEEFCWAMGTNPELIPRVTRSLKTKEPIDTVFNKVLDDLFRRYVVVGGMPASVEAYSRTRDYTESMRELDMILGILRLDVSRYSPRKDIMRISACMDSIPSQLADDKKSFRYSDIEKIKGVGKREYGSSIDWLINAGVVLKCNNLLSVDPPLDMNMEEDTFKLYLCDTGLMMALCGYRDVQSIITGDPFVNNGVLMENAVACALHAKGYPLFYHAKKNSTLEVDFVMKYEDRVCIIEVKSGASKRSKSLNTLLAEPNRNRMGYKVCEGNVSTDVNKAIHIPLYGPWLFDEPSIPEVPPMDMECINAMLIEKMNGS